MFVVFANTLPFYFPARDGLPETMRNSAVFRTEVEASEFLSQQEAMESERAIKAITHS